MCKDLEALAHCQSSRRSDQGLGNDPGGHNNDSESCSKWDGKSVEGFEQRNDML